MEEESAATPVDVCNVVIVYDDDTTRNRAMTACDYLVQQFWEGVDLEFHWWRTDFLGDPHLAELAARNAVDADFLIVCLSNLPLSLKLQSWFESWIFNRRGRSGALLNLAGTPRESPLALPKDNFLREIGRHGGFDYLSDIPSPAMTPPEQYREQSTPPSHFGLNE